MPSSVLILIIKVRLTDMGEEVLLALNLILSLIRGVNLNLDDQQKASSTETTLCLIVNNTPKESERRDTLGG